MTTTLNDKNLENVTQQVKSTTILDKAKHLSVAPPRDENVMIIDGLLNRPAPGCQIMCSWSPVTPQVTS